MKTIYRVIVKALNLIRVASAHDVCMQTRGDHKEARRFEGELTAIEKELDELDDKLSAFDGHKSKL